MSRLDDSRAENPSQRWFKWSGGEGKLSYYDKEKKENIDVPLPFRFLLLDTFHTVRGFNDSKGKGVYSNEVKDIAKEILSVKIDKDQIGFGLYKDIKDKVKAEGGKYAQSCYIAYYDENKELAIGNIMMSGSSLSGGHYKNGKDEVELGAWMDFAKSPLLYKKAIEMSLNPQDCKKGATTYKIPSFKLIEISEETDNKAKDLCNILNAYIEPYLQRNQEVNGVMQNVVNNSNPNLSAEDRHNAALEKNRVALDLHKPVEEGNFNESFGLMDGSDDLPF